MAYPTGELTVDLRAIADNWRYLNRQLPEGTACAAVVKANAYGLGVDRIAPKIYAAGCRHFFVANLKEAMQLQSLVGLDADIFVLTGCNPGAESEFIRRNLIPVIVSYSMLKRWAEIAKNEERARAVLKVNTGMGRLGIEPVEFDLLLSDAELLRNARFEYLMSHLACADDQSNPLNAIQLQRFHEMKDALHGHGVKVKTTLANSAGIFLGDRAQGDLVRPGIALYGGNPGKSKNPMQRVVGLSLPIIQVRLLPAGEAVGYGATRTFEEERYIAVVSGGYADGIMRCLSNKGWGHLFGCKVPIVGRISMDSTMFDVTDVAREGNIEKASAIEFLGDNILIDDVAAAADTISYEILTSLGSRYERCYLD